MYRRNNGSRTAARIAAILGAFLTAGLFMSCAGLPEPMPPEQLVISEVLAVDKSRDELYGKAKNWMLDFSNPRESRRMRIDYQDREAGQLVGRGIIDVRYRFGTRPTRFLLTIHVEDGLARLAVQHAFYIIRENPTREQALEGFDEGYYQPRQRLINSESLMRSFRPEVLKLFEELEASMRGDD
jgi:hypothetical protein